MSAQASAEIIYFPMPQTRDPEMIFCGRMQALQQYKDAKTDAERRRALFWVNHWRILDAHAKAQEALSA